MKHPAVFPFFFVMLSFFSCSSDENSNELSPPLVAEVREGVSYGSDDQQVYDIYLPEGRSSNTTKVVILVHGGGWTGGDKAGMANFVSLIQTEHPDHAIVNMNYVLATSSVAAFPNQFLDVGRVIDQLTSREEELQILPEFGLIGVSAGAHISLMYDYVYDTDDQVKMVCDIVGPTDFTDPFYADNPNFDLLLAVLVDESAYPNGTNFAEATSPALQVSSAGSPSILFYGNQDPLVPLTNGERLNVALTNAQIAHAFTVYEGGHGNDWSEASYEDMQVQISGFIDTYLEML